MPNADASPDQADMDVSFRRVKFTSSWREEALTRICELRALISSFRMDEALSDRRRELLDKAAIELDHAGHTARQRSLVRRGTLTGAAVQRVHGHLDTAEVLVLRAATSEYVHGQIPALVAHVRRHLVPSDPRCQSAERALRSERAGVRGADADTDAENAATSATRQVATDHHGRLIAAVQGAMAEARNEQMRVRSFRNILLIFAVLLFVLAIGICVLGVAAPKRIPVCFEPVQLSSGQTAAMRLVCPTGESELFAGADVDAVIAQTAHRWDIPLIELLGLIAASIAATAAFRKVRGTNTPYSLPATLALLKLPLGALTALLGLILMRANFIPGLSALDDSAQIIGWAVAFGYAQQAFTQVVDRKTQDLLDDVGGAEQREKSANASPQRP
jgi:hypothetical protein